MLAFSRAGRQNLKGGKVCADAETGKPVEVRSVCEGGLCVLLSDARPHGEEREDVSGTPSSEQGQHRPLVVDRKRPNSYDEKGGRDEADEERFRHDVQPSPARFA